MKKVHIKNSIYSMDPYMGLYYFINKKKKHTVLNKITTGVSFETPLQDVAVFQRQYYCAERIRLLQTTGLLQGQGRAFPDYADHKNSTP